jgi:serine/threonine protein kinase/WD40 repeat protein
MNGPKHSIPTVDPISQDPSTTDSDLRLAEAVIEYETLLRSGATLDLQHFLERHKELQPALGECIEAFGFVNQAAKQPLFANPLPLTQTLLGDFQILRKVGAGGMGEVYEAHQLSLARRVALKVMSSSQTGDERSLKRFQAEAQAAATLQHPHIVPVFSTGQVDKTYYYAMQFIEGASVAELLVHFRSQAQMATSQQIADVAAQKEASTDRIDADAATVVNDQSSQETYRDGSQQSREFERHPWHNLIPLSADYFRVVAQVIQQAAEALHHAHEHDIIHRDIKPSNLLIDLKGKIWVADFGLARLPNSNLTATADVLGTARYMSPEQASGQSVALDGRTDVYSLGATLYELLTLHPVFESDDRRNILRMVSEREPTPLSHHCKSIPRDLQIITTKALSKDVAQRYVSAAALAEDLKRFLQHRPILAKPPTFQQIFLKWCKRNLSLIMGIAIFIFLALIVGVVSVSIALNRISFANNKTIAANSQLTTALDEKDAALYRANMILARHDWDGGSHEGARARLDATSKKHRMWEWYYMDAICSTPSRQMASSSFSDLAFAISPDGRYVIRLNPKAKESLLTIQHVPTWNESPEKFLRFQPRDKGFQFSNVHAYTFSKDGILVAAIESDNSISVVKTKTGELYHQVTSPFPIHGSIWLEDNGSVMAPLLNGEKIEIWDLGSEVKLSEIADTTKVKCWSPNGERIYSESGIVRQSRTGREICRFSDRARDAIAEGICKFSPDNRLLAGSSRIGISVIDTNSGFDRNHFAQERIEHFAFSPEGTRLAATAEDRSLKVYDLMSGSVLFNTYIDAGKQSVVEFQEDGTTLVSATNVQIELRDCLDFTEGDRCPVGHAKELYGEFEVVGEAKSGESRSVVKTDIRNSEVLGTYKLPQQDFTTYEVCAKTMVAALYMKSRLLLWDLQTESIIAEFPGLHVYKMRFSKDGNWLVMGCGVPDRATLLLDVKQKKIHRNLDPSGQTVRCLQFSQDSQRVYGGYTSGEVLAWDTQSGLRQWSVKCSTEAINLIEVDPTLKYVAATGLNDVINIYRADNGVHLSTLTGHASHLTSMAFHPTEPRLATSASFSGIRIWDTNTWEPIFSIPSTSTSTKLEFSPSGDRLISFQSGTVVSFGRRDQSSRDEQRRNWLTRSLGRSERAMNWFAAEWFLRKLIEMEPKNLDFQARLEKIAANNPSTKSPSKSPPKEYKIEELSLKKLESAYVLVAKKCLEGDLEFAVLAADQLAGQIDESCNGFTASLVYRLYLFGPRETSKVEALLPAFAMHTKTYKSQFAKHFVRGGLLYRAGKYELALESLKLAETFELDSESHALNWLFMSMTMLQLDRLPEAESWLVRAKRWRASMSSYEFYKLDFQVRVPFNVLVLEAERLVEEKKKNNKKETTQNTSQ